MAETPVPHETGGSEPTLLYLMKQLEQAVRARLEDLVRPEGLTALQYTALTVLEHHTDMSSAQLARSSFVTAQAMSDMVTILLDRGLIERQRDGGDRRRFVLSLSVQGRLLLERLRGQVGALEREMLTDLGPGQAAELRRAVIACRRALSGRPPR